MFKRLFVLLLLVAATISVSTPAQASTLAVSLYCDQTSAGPSTGAFDCWSYASGGVPSYTFQWYRLTYWGYTLVKQESGTSVSSLSDLCPTGSSQSTRVIVTDSAGAQVTVTRTVRCYAIVP